MTQSENNPSLSSYRISSKKSNSPAIGATSGGSAQALQRADLERLIQRKVEDEGMEELKKSLEEVLGGLETDVLIDEAIEKVEEEK